MTVRYGLLVALFGTLAFGTQRSKDNTKKRILPMHDLSQVRQLSIEVMDTTSAAGQAAAAGPENDDYVDDEADLETFHGVAFQARFKQDKLTAEESLAFPEVVDEQSTMQYFVVRNSILKLWFRDPKTQLLIETVYLNFKPPPGVDSIFISRVFYFLERHGYINFGVFQLSSSSAKNLQPKIKVIILGAGVSGLNAARQLKFFGFDVTLLEPRDRIGGRVYTYKYHKNTADVGAQTITGLNGNPLRVINKQIDMKLRPVGERCPLYANFQPIDPHVDEVVERMFNKFVDTANLIRNHELIKNSPYAPRSLGDGINVVIHKKERDVILHNQEYKHKIYKLYCFMDERLQKCIDLQETIKALKVQHEKMSKVRRLPKDEFSYRKNKFDINEAIALHERYLNEVQQIEERIKVLESKGTTDVYLNADDKVMLNWHFANLEFATGTQLTNLSLTEWDHDEENPFGGAHLYLKNGYSVLPQALAEGLDIKLNTAVRQVKIFPNRMEVQTVALGPPYQQDQEGLSKKLTSGQVQTMVADAVLCTVPLGVLKNSVTEFDDSSNFGSANKIEFIPSLPEEKIRAIKNMGYGNWNKVVLVFDQIFWKKEEELFGNVVNGPPSSRGELFLFWSVTNQPVLLALIAGESADRMEKVDDEIIKRKCLTILQGIFKTTSTLKNFYVTRWKSDPWSIGVYSHLGVNSTSNDYNTLAEPIGCGMKGSDGKSLPRLFFAGEHTTREYPATVHGAFLTGIREATRIANQFQGVPYNQPKKM